MAAYDGLSNTYFSRARCAHPICDIGKMGIPNYIVLNYTRLKRGSLSPDQWEILNGRAPMGANILGNSRSRFLAMGAEIALNHHQRWDGSGYPAGKRGDAIPMAARVMNICDIYHALHSKRACHPAFDHAKSMQIIAHGNGRIRPKHFDPKVLAALIHSENLFCKIFETGSAC